MSKQIVIKQVGSPIRRARRHSALPLIGLGLNKCTVLRELRRHHPYRSRP